jgi:hypothetical protein
MKLVKESLYFERPTSEREFRNKLFGFRKGQLIKRMEEEDGKFVKVFMIIKKTEEEMLEVQLIGTLCRKRFKGPLISFIHELELKDYFHYFYKNKLVVTDLEIKLIKEDLSTEEGQEFLNKLKLKTGLTPYEIN